MKNAYTGMLGAVLAGAAMIGAAAETLERAPFNPDFLRYNEQLRAGALVNRTAAGHGLGYLPPPYKLPASATASSAPEGQKQALPARYDLRDYNKVTPVKDQGQEGNCWAFAAYGSLESCMKFAAPWDFSENNMANLHGFNSAYGWGGNAKMALAYLNRWSGPIWESDDPYSNGAGGSPLNIPARRHVQNAAFVADRTSATDNTKIKNTIVNFGAIYSTMCWVQDPYYLRYGSTYYFPNQGTLANHAIAIAGWDDNFSRTKFAITPPGDGAFLVRNSWGPSWGDGGYFWVSYYDAVIGKDNALFYNADGPANYQTIYQYDTLGLCGSYGYGKTTAWGANIFSGVSGSIQSVGFYALADGARYEIRMYTGVAPGKPTSGSLYLTKTGAVMHAGYYTVLLGTYVPFNTRFSVVIKFTTPGNNQPVPVEEYLSSYSSKATAAPGESYISADGVTWSEARNPYNDRYMNICIKAYGSGSSTPTPPPPPPASYTPQMNDFDGDGSGDPALYNDQTCRWTVRLSRNGYAPVAFQSGAHAGDPPFAGYWDNDGNADPTIYDTVTGRWRVALSSAGYRWYYLNRQWRAAAGEMPVLEDFDGDGWADPTFYNQMAGKWYILLSSYNWLSYYTLGYSADAWILPLAGDFDGDGRADPTFYSTKTYNWYILPSSWNYRNYATIEHFGSSGDKASIGDLDGDGRADACVRSAAGAWRVLLSGTGWLNKYAFSW